MGKSCNLPLFRLGIALALASVMAACTKGGQFDPTTLLDNDMFDNKKIPKGQRELVFPNGVPGASTGIPADLYKGYQPPPVQAADTGDGAMPITPPVAEAPKAEAKLEPRPRPKPKPKVARARARPRTEISIGLAKRPKPATQPAQTVWPAPPSTAAAQPAQTVWPAPPSTAASQPAQTVWPAPPSTAAAAPAQTIWPNPPPTSSQ